MVNSLDIWMEPTVPDWCWREHPRIEFVGASPTTTTFRNRPPRETFTAIHMHSDGVEFVVAMLMQTDESSESFERGHAFTCLNFPTNFQGANSPHFQQVGVRTSSTVSAIRAPQPFRHFHRFTSVSSLRFAVRCGLGLERLVVDLEVCSHMSFRRAQSRRSIPCAP